jgi:2-(1,2-epoxy-1,2-dihydrophenyl)acetyl-CoA isomerase
MSAQVLFARHDRVGLITLNRPEKLNAFADRMRDELAEVTGAAAKDDTIGALVITGAGRAFSAGGDIQYMHDLVAREEWDTLEALVKAGERVVALIDSLAKPVVAAVNGAAAGGGASLALACDIRVAAASASIGLTFNRIGLQPDWGGTYFLPRLVGLGRALELALTGDMLPAEEALRLGLFNHLVDEGRLIEQTLALAARLAAKPPLAVALTKQALRQSLVSSLPEALDRERTNQMRLFRSTHARAAMRAFLDTRTAAHGHKT